MSNFLASCLTSRAMRHGMTILAASVSLATLLRAQPASITNTPPAFYAPIIPATSDAAGNVYYIATNPNNPSYLPLTPGAAQTQYGGGTCYLPRADAFGRIENFPIPCTDAWVAKVDASGNLVFGTLLGGPTNDYGTALAAVRAAGLHEQCLRRRVSRQCLFGPSR
jgi:hypothetical protein